MCVATPCMPSNAACWNMSALLFNPINCHILYPVIKARGNRCVTLHGSAASHPSPAPCCLFCHTLSHQALYSSPHDHIRTSLCMPPLTCTLPMEVARPPSPNNSLVAAPTRLGSSPSFSCSQQINEQLSCLLLECSSACKGFWCRTMLRLIEHVLSHPNPLQQAGGCLLQKDLPAICTICFCQATIMLSGCTARLCDL